MKAFRFAAWVLGCCLWTLGCGNKAEKSPPTPSTNTSIVTGNPLTAPVEYLGVLNQAQKSAVRVTDIATVNQAIQMFRATEDRFPKDLNELVKERYLQKLPAVPTGMKFLYNPQNGMVRIVAAPPPTTPPAPK